MTKPVRPRLAVACLALAFAVAALAVSPAVAQRRTLLKDSPKVKAAFRQVVEDAREWVVEVYCQEEDNKPQHAALGTIVGAEGWVLTKASEVYGDITCKVPGKGQHAAKLVGVHNEHDLAMLKIDADELAVVRWNTASHYSAGQWVVAAGVDEDPLAVGVVSVSRRKIPAAFGLLGVRLIDPRKQREEEKRPVGARIERVTRGSAADRAGIKDGDVITHVNGKATPSNRDLVMTIRRFKPGERIKVTFLRGEKQAVVTAVLKSPPPTFQDQLGGQKLSLRATGFPSAFQHDTVLLPNHCGGPLVGLDGKAMGINIARAGRVVSYAIPSDVVLTLLDELKSGRLAPPEAVVVQSSLRPEQAPGPREEP